MIDCKYIYENASESDGIRVNVARFVTKALRESKQVSWQVHMPDVAPSPELLAEFKNKQVKFPMFVKRFLEEMKSPTAQVSLKALASLSMTGNVTLLCYEKTDTFCHRRFVKDIVENILRMCEHDYERVWTNDITPAIKIIEDRFSSKFAEVESAEVVKE